jgi:hypothetical protein
LVSSDAKKLNIPVLGPEEPAISRIMNIFEHHYKIPVNLRYSTKKTIKKY